MFAENHIQPDVRNSDRGHRQRGHSENPAAYVQVAHAEDSVVQACRAIGRSRGARPGGARPGGARLGGVASAYSRGMVAQDRASLNRARRKGGGDSLLFPGLEEIAPLLGVAIWVAPCWP